MDLTAENFENYQELIVCSNYLKNFTSIIRHSDSGFEPLAIKESSCGKPLVFLKGFDRNSSTSIEVVNGDKSVISGVAFEHSKTGCLVTFNETVILELVLNENNIMEVINLDMRPLGYNIFGNTASLNMGGNAISRSSAINSDSFLGI